MFICEAIAASRVTLGAGEGADGPCLAPDLIGEGRSKSAPCNWWLPTWTGLIVRGAPPNAAVSASAITR